MHTYHKQKFLIDRKYKKDCNCAYRYVITKEEYQKYRANKTYEPEGKIEYSKSSESSSFDPNGGFKIKGYVSSDDDNIDNIDDVPDNAVADRR